MILLPQLVAINRRNECRAWLRENGFSAKDSSRKHNPTTEQTTRPAIHAERGVVVCARNGGIVCLETALRRTVTLTTQLKMPAKAAATAQSLLGIYSDAKFAPFILLP